MNDEELLSKKSFKMELQKEVLNNSVLEIYWMIEKLCT